MADNHPKIILASSSAARKMMLDNVGLPYTAKPAYINERAIINDGLDNEDSIQDITALLAQQKALHVAKDNTKALVIGSDQTLEFEGQVLSKAENADEATEKLRALRGKTHFLHSAVSVVRGADILFTHTETAQLTMHDFDEAFLESYITRESDALVSCVGGYKIEGAGAWLFSSITGDNFTIMGMPLLALLGFLNQEFGFKL
ncbi:MAG: Maf family protein [Alphaproteobacteria bacterium]